MTDHGVPNFNEPMQVGVTIGKNYLSLTVVDVAFHALSGRQKFTLTLAQLDDLIDALTSAQTEFDEETSILGGVV